MIAATPLMNPAAASRFAEYLRARQSSITDAWVEAVRSDYAITSSPQLLRLRVTESGARLNVTEINAGIRVIS
jgi:hypothetical protein